MLKFPKDNIQAPPIGDFGECESKSAFQEMKHIDKQFKNLRKNVTIHSAVFNLNDLEQYIDASVTELVTVKADTVYMTDILTIDFNLTIWARTISLSNPIHLVYHTNQNSLPKNLEIIQQCELFNDKIKLRFRKLGYLQLWDEMRLEYNTNIKCDTKNQLTFNNVNITHWYDSTIVNMMYLCCAASLKNQFKSKTIGDVIEFVINLYSDKDKIKDLAYYFNAQKFVRLRIRQEITKFHQVPELDYDDFKDYHNTLDDKWEEYILSLNDLTRDIYDKKKDIFEVNSKAVEVENILLKQLNEEKLFMYYLMEGMNMSWIGSMDDRYHNFQ